MPKSFFISDVHIGAGSQEEERLKLSHLISFFNFINQNGNRLYIVGDLFDFWFEYKHAISNQHFKILYQISKLIENGVELHFLPGNHDCWIRNFLSQQLNIIIHPEISNIEIHSKKISLFHGDGISKKDKGYQILKKIFRNPINILFYRWIHPDIGIPLAKFMSASSRQHTSSKELNDEDDYIGYAKDKFSEGFDYVIVGHSHRPLLHKFDDKIFLNLGNWISDNSYGQLENGELTLNFWKD